MKTIWKYAIPIQLGVPFGTFDVPREAKLLHVAEQHGAVALWFEVDSEAKTIPRTFVLIGTGHDMTAIEAAEPNQALVHRGTSLHAGGDLVLHCYEAVRS